MTPNTLTPGELAKVTLGRIALALVVAMLVLPSAAHAYLDAGSASLIFQALIAAVLGGLFIVKMYWLKIKRAIGFAPPEPAASTDVAAKSEAS